LKLSGCFIFINFLLILAAKAEYRAYQYIVKTSDSFAIATKSEPQYIVSTLNPQMYKSYHGGNSITIDLLRTWICPGYTGSRQKVCDHPYDKSGGQ
jgi:hypothetical protein